MSIWNLAFRPFFLFGSVYSAIAMVIWLSFLSGRSAFGEMDPFIWHSHEMIYGFVTAIIAGFILTVVQNWTGIPGLKGSRLKFLFALWLMGRILMWIPGSPALLTAAVDLSFFPVLTFFLIPYFRSPELGTERFFYLFFLLFFAGNLLVHLETVGLDPFHFSEGTAHVGIRIGLDSALLVTLFMSGRVIPFFTESSIARAQPRTYVWTERLAPATAAAFVFGDFFFRGTVVLASIAFITALVHAIRLAGWQVRRIRRVPLIWVLHLAYLWIVIGLGLSGLAALGKLPVSLSTHAFTVGGLGLMIYGMISRVSLGHTGRRLHPTAWTVGGYALLAIAAVVRVFTPLFPTVNVQWVWLGAGICWTIAFFIFIVQYSPILTQPRADGRPE